VTLLVTNTGDSCEKCDKPGIMPQFRNEIPLNNVALHFNRIEKSVI